MRWPTTSAGALSTVLNAGGGATAGSSNAKGAAISSTNKLQLDTAAVAATDFFMGGVRAKPAGIARVSTAGAVAFHAAGLPMTSSGQLCVVVGGTPSFWVGGVPISSAGRVCVSAVT